MTPRNTEVSSLAGGMHHHFGIEKALVGAFKLSKVNCHDRSFPDTLTLHINIDGIPLSKSSNDCFWPILAVIKQVSDVGVFIIGLYSGKSKPTSVQEYLKEFINDFLSLKKSGFFFQKNFFS